MNVRILRRLAALGFALQLLGQLLDLFGLLIHADRQDLKRGGLLDFIAQLAGQRVQPLDPFPEFLLLLEHLRAFRGRRVGHRTGIALIFWLSGWWRCRHPARRSISRYGRLSEHHLSRGQRASRDRDGCQESASRLANSIQVGLFSTHFTAHGSSSKPAENRAPTREQRLNDPRSPTVPG